MYESYQKWLDGGCPEVICKCGCGEEIVILNNHKYYGIPKYIKGHKKPTEETKQKMRDNHYDCSGKNNPNFRKHPTEETRQKMRDASTNENNHNFGKHLTEETRQKISESEMGKIVSEETKQKMRGKIVSEETKQKLSNALKGRLTWNKDKINVYSDITLDKMSKAQKGNKSHRFGKPAYSKSGYGKGSYYNSPLQGKIWLRSSYELAYAQYLDDYNIPWLYEIQTFDLGNTTYTPDFFLPTSNMFIEIKGYMRPEAQEKINKFLNEYPDETLQILYKEDLIKLGCDLK